MQPFVRDILCLIPLGLSTTFAFCHPNITVNFVFALLSVFTVSVLQKHAVRSITSWLWKKRRHYLAFILDALFGNWAELSLAVVAVLKIDMVTTQVLLLSIVATNYFLLLGLGRMYDHNAPDAIDAHYAPALLFSLVMTVLPTALGTAGLGFALADMAPSSATVLQKAATMAHIIAILSLVIFVAHLTLVCYLHSGEQRFSLSVLKHARDTEKDEPIRRDSSHTHNSLLTKRHAWRDYDREPAFCHAGSDEVSWRCVAILISSSFCHPLLCIALVDATAPELGRWSVLVFVKILITTLLMALTGLTGAVTYAAHVQQIKSSRKELSKVVDVAKARAGVVALITRLLLFARPLCVVIQWAVYGTPPPAVALFPAALLLAAYFLENSMGEIVPGVGLIVLYVLFNAYFLTMT